MPNIFGEYRRVCPYNLTLNRSVLEQICQTAFVRSCFFFQPSRFHPNLSVALKIAIIVLNFQQFQLFHRVQFEMFHWVQFEMFHGVQWWGWRKVSLLVVKSTWGMTTYSLHLTFAECMLPRHWNRTHEPCKQEENIVKRDSNKLLDRFFRADYIIFFIYFCFVHSRITAIFHAYARLCPHYRFPLSLTSL